MRLRSLVAVASLVPALVACERGSRVTDRNGDGVVRIVCMGDSNTEGALVPERRSWCERLAARHPGWEVQNGGVRYAQATGSGFISGWALLGMTLGSNPDAVLISLGTNDLANLGRTPEETVDALVALRDQAVAANVDVFIGTIPPVFRAPGDGAAARIEAANAILARRLPADILMDFHAGLERQDLDVGGLHLGPSGHEKYAIAAERCLTQR